MTENGDALVPVEVGDQTVYIAVRDLNADTDDEQEIAARRLRLDPVLDGLAAFGAEFVRRFEGLQASKVTVQFGCQIGFEAGRLITMVGKVSGSSTISVSLEWTRPEP